jgi:hypothetical protein
MPHPSPATGAANQTFFGPHLHIFETSDAAYNNFFRLSYACVYIPLAKEISLTKHPTMFVGSH